MQQVILLRTKQKLDDARSEPVNNNKNTKKNIKILNLYRKTGLTSLGFDRY